MLSATIVHLPPIGGSPSDGTLSFPPLKRVGFSQEDHDGTSDSHLPLGAPSQGGISLEQELRELHNFRYDGTITLQVFSDRHWLLESARLVRKAWG